MLLRAWQRPRACVPAEAAYSPTPPPVCSTLPSSLRSRCVEQEDPEAAADDMALPLKTADEFRPFVRKVPEFKFW